MLSPCYKSSAVINSLDASLNKYTNLKLTTQSYLLFVKSLYSMIKYLLHKTIRVMELDR